MAAMAINSKNRLKSSSSEQEGQAYDFGTWHEASGNGALQSFFV